MKKIRLIVSSILSIMLLSGCVKVSEAPGEQTEGNDTKNFDEAVEDNIRPQDDYYGYINYEALSSMEIGYGDVSAGTFDEVQNSVNEELAGIIKNLTSETGFLPGSNEQLIMGLYNQCFEYDFDNQLSETILWQAVEQIEEADTIEAYVKALGELSREYGVQIFLMPCVIDDYFKTDEYAFCVNQMTCCAVSSLEDLLKDRDTGNSLKEYALDVLTASGIDYAQADKRSDEFVNLLLEVASETDFSLQHMDQSTFEALTFMTEQELSESLSHIDLNEFLKACGITDNPYDGWYVQDEAQLSKINDIFIPENLEALKTCALCELINSYGMFLSDTLISKYFNLGFMEPEEKALLCVNTYMGTQLGEMYARLYDTPEGEILREDVISMCEKIREAYSEMIMEADWLSIDAREAFVRKLQGIQFLVGAGKEHEVIPEDAELIGEELLETIINLNRKKLRDNLEQAGRKKDKDRFIMSACTVNACYSLDNTVTIPFGICHSPFYDTDMDEFTNIGALGMVIAHEISHGFDSSCICFDDKGVYNPEWIGEEDRESFKERMKRVESYYSRFTVMDVYHVDGELTLGENFADLGGMECIVRLAKNDEELQKLFESYASVWCELSVDTSAISWLSLDVHSPSMVRVNAVLSSTDAFYELYKLTEADEMYIAPEERVSRW